MILVVRKEIHSSSGKLKNVKQAFKERSNVVTAEGISLAHLSLKVLEKTLAFSWDEA